MTDIEDIEKLEYKLRVACNYLQKAQHKYLKERGWEISLCADFGIRTHIFTKGGETTIDEDHAMEVEQDDT